MITKNTATITLDGTKQEVRFNRNYPYFWVQNLGDSDVLMSLDADVVKGKDGVIVVPPGGSSGTMHNYDADRFHLLGTGEVQVMGTTSAHNPFKQSGKGGDNNSSIEGLSPVTDSLAFALETTFTDFKNTNYVGLPSTYGINTGIAERTVEVVNTCGTGDSFIISFGKTSYAGGTFSLTETEFVGYYSGMAYSNLAESIGKTRYICCLNYDKALKIYVNGVKVAEGELTHSCNPVDDNFSLNSWNGNAPIASENCITHGVRIYNRMLTEDEIQNNFLYYKQRYGIV